MFLQKKLKMFIFCKIYVIFNVILTKNPAFSLCNELNLTNFCVCYTINMQWGYRQVVRHWILTPIFGGSSPSTPANRLRVKSFFMQKKSRMFSTRYFLCAVYRLSALSSTFVIKPFTQVSSNFLFELNVKVYVPE